MIGSALGVVLDGLDAMCIHVEADVSRGLPTFSIVGLPDSAVSESKQRIRAAIQNAGLPFPRERITVNLSPASVRKRGAGLDLAIAIAILRAQNTISPDAHQDIAFCAELNLSGTLCSVAGITQLALGLRRTGVLKLLVPARLDDELLYIPDLLCYHAATLRDVVAALQSNHFDVHQFAVSTMRESSDSGDFDEVRGLQEIKRGMAIAAVGQHHLMLVGPPGSGKSMLAERLHTILPLLSDEQAIGSYALHQAVGQPHSPSRVPTTRMPHHSITRAGLIGGGQPFTPGEVTLAHDGVLVLDELLEFSRPVLQSLREPLTQGSVRLARMGKHITLPAGFQLVATLNPCPCGLNGYGDCQCGQQIVLQYWRKVSGPILDRIDISLAVPSDKSGSDHQMAASSADLRHVITSARAILAERAAWLSARGVSGNLPLDFNADARTLVDRLTQHLLLSGRGAASLVKIARSIASLEGKDAIAPVHVHEAAGLRTHNKIT